MGAFGQALGQQTAMGAVNAGVSGLFGAVNSAIGARVGWKYQKKQMALQNKYDIEAFNRENARQDELFRTQLSMQKQGLKNAGYSTANPDSAVLPEATINNQDTPNSTFNPYQTTSLPDFGISYMDMKQGQVADAQASYLREQAEGQRITNTKLAERLQSEIDQARAHVNRINTLLPSEKEKLDKEVNLLVANKELTDEQAEVARKQFEQLEQLIESIKIDNYFKPAKIQAEINKTRAEAYAAWQSGDYQKIIAGLAQDGVVVNGNILGQLATLLHEGKFTAGTVLNKFEHMIGLDDDTSAASAVKSALQEWIIEPAYYMYNKWQRSAEKHRQNYNAHQAEK